MGSDDYITPGGGLKLKGSKPLGVEKKKKKKSSSSKKPREGSPSSGSSSKTSALQKALEDEDAEMTRAKAAGEPEGGERELEERDLRDGKTPAERQAEEMRRKRLHERLAREGIKTHKQRVEELNKYLSNLSEHHDMPRIGPG
ncbi:hypothetical protein M430DRAFT_24925 [Amorphotheca resinae ATCC 22711]|uniref:DUF1754-domain-containing protein n=1 Tax=Amorphotheca resinae ATCC 22711 TaxID=857342 RepID=A0A2T3B9X1_AMORE|nr:hypothetical protein M430DRAFT_24925 [Amorphotheca resinae ATCC 22711]PSS25080.1 hypothetical protein M430DRAFT_24925 [Amorphotheca resinae ATCC 22711]